MKQKKRILRDHVRRGKKLIPPWLREFGPWTSVSWVKTMMPELLWISLIHEHHGHQEGAALVTTIARAARELLPQSKKKVFAAASEFGELSVDGKSGLRSRLEASTALGEYQAALGPLLALYPECPLEFLHSREASLPAAEREDLNLLKNSVRKMYDRVSQDTTMVQASAIWLAFDSGLLKVTEGVALADFPEIEDYPNTEKSEKVAASVRCALKCFFAEPYYANFSKWPNYFWNRGLELEACCFEEGSDDTARQSS